MTSNRADPVQPRTPASHRPAQAPRARGENPDARAQGGSNDSKLSKDCAVTSGLIPRIAARRADATSNAALIVAAARRVFSRGDGLGSLEEIAREAGVGIATLYRHFARREVLASAVYNQIFDDEFTPALERARLDPSPIHGLRVAAERLPVVIARTQGLAASAGNFAAMTDDLLKRFTEPLHEIVRKAQQAGEMRDDIGVDDLPRLFVMAVAGLTTPGLPQGAHHRYLTLLFDALRPEGATPLPPIQPA